MVKQGDLRSARPFYERALGNARRVPNYEEGVATQLNNLAELLRAQGKLDEAEPLCKESLAIDKQAYGNDHPEVTHPDRLKVTHLVLQDGRSG